MRGLKHNKQLVYWSRVVETLDGINTVYSYKQPEKYFFPVSATAGTPEELSAGYVPNYDRYITYFKKSFQPEIADVLWVDRKPELDECGNLVLNEDGYATVQPDYRIIKIIGTKSGAVFRAGIKMIDGEENA